MTTPNAIRELWTGTAKNAQEPSVRLDSEPFLVKNRVCLSVHAGFRDFGD